MSRFLILALSVFISSVSYAAIEIDNTDDSIYGTISFSDYPISMCVWAEAIGDTENDVVLSVADSSATSERLAIQFAGAETGDPARGFCDEPASRVDTSTGFTVGTIHSVCFVLTNSTSRAIYIDGGSKGTDTDTCSVTISNIDRVGVGVHSDSTPGTWFDGIVYEAAIWDVALSDADVLNWHNMRQKRGCLNIQPSNLKGCWQLDSVVEDSSADGATYYDITGQISISADDGANNSGLVSRVDKEISYP